VEKPHTTPHCMAALETAMQAGPTDVFWLQERWKVSVEKRRPISQWLPPEAHGGEKPHRGLIWLPGFPPGWQLPEEWQHADVRYEVALDAHAEPPAWLPEETRVHRLRGGTPREALREIDAADPLPLDFILSGPEAADLAQAAAHEQIRLVALR
jgi:hypothetical protein